MSSQRREVAEGPNNASAAREGNSLAIKGNTMKTKVGVILMAAVLAVTADLLSSCTTSNFTSYEGAQNWPVSQGALVDRKYAVPVYYGPPQQPYIVIGLLELGNATAGTEVGAAANKAKQRGADAIIVLSHGSGYVGTYSTGTVTAYGATAYGTGISVPIIAGEAKVAVIRWVAPRNRSASVS
jgi:hypothetical protein